MKEKHFIYIIFFIFLQFLIVVRNLMHPESNSILWFCDFVPTLLALGFYFQNNQFIKSLINIGLIAQFIALIEVVLFLAFKIQISNLGRAVLSEGTFSVFVFLAMHFFSVALALIATYKEEPKPISLFYSALVIIFMFVFTLLFGSRQLNVNYLFSFSEFGIQIQGYTLFWPLLVFLFLVMPTYVLQKIIYSFTKK